MDFNSWICFILASVMAYLECLFKTVRSGNLSLLLYLAVSSALAIGSCKSDKRAAKLHLLISNFY